MLSVQALVRGVSESEITFGRFATASADQLVGSSDGEDEVNTNQGAGQGQSTRTPSPEQPRCTAERILIPLAVVVRWSPSSPQRP